MQEAYARAACSCEACDDWLPDEPAETALGGRMLEPELM
jgi:hypothetical protein